MNFKEGGEGSSSSKWSQIGGDVLGLILERLCLTDPKLSAQVGDPLSLEPLLTSIVHHYLNCHLFFFKQMIQDIFHSSTCPQKGVLNCTGSSRSDLLQDCYGTIQGWLIMVQACTGFRSIFFFNPLTKAKVFMPSRLKCEGRIRKIVASPKPSDPNCVVACLFVDANILAFSWISDEAWTLIEGSLKAGIIFKEVEILDGKLYALNQLMLDSAIVCDLQEKPVKPKLLAAKWDDDFGLICEAYSDIFRSLAIDASSRELLLIYMFHNSTHVDNHWENGYISLPKYIESKVFKLEMRSSEARWSEVKNLGNRMLFVGHRKSLVASTIGLHGRQELIKDNCVYFAHLFSSVGDLLDQWKGLTIGRHCRSDQRMDYYTFKRSSLVKVPSPIWFIPSLW